MSQLLVSVIMHVCPGGQPTNYLPCLENKAFILGNICKHFISLFYTAKIMGTINSFYFVSSSEALTRVNGHKTVSFKKFSLISVKFEMVLKQSSLNKVIPIWSENVVIRRSNCCFNEWVRNLYRWFVFNYLSTSLFSQGMKVNSSFYAVW